MSTHIETISAEYVVVTYCPAGETINPEDDTDMEPLSQPGLILSDMDSAVVIIGSKERLTDIVERAAKAVAALPD